MGDLTTVPSATIHGKALKSAGATHANLRSTDTMGALLENTHNDANTGSILGWGFPKNTGGILNFVNVYGIKKFMERSDKLAEQFGNRFNPPNLLKQMAKSGENFK